MKVNLIVTATGTNQGRAIPIAGSKFLIGRDADCNLRPASQAISKKHCQVTVREGKVYVQDMGSTNGTFVRGEAITGETEVQSGDSLKVGPLEFKVEISMSSVVQKKTDATPLPDKMKALSTESAEKLKAVMAPKVPTTTPSATTPVKKPAPVADAEMDAAAMMLLGMDDDSPSEIAAVMEGGTTIMEMPAMNPDGTPKAPATPGKPDKKKTLSGAEMSTAANDLLRKYIRRTGT